MGGGGGRKDDIYPTRYELKIPVKHHFFYLPDDKNLSPTQYIKRRRKSLTTVVLCHRRCKKTYLRSASTEKLKIKFVSVLKN